MNYKSVLHNIGESATFVGGAAGSLYGTLLGFSYLSKLLGPPPADEYIALGMLGIGAATTIIGGTMSAMLYESKIKKARY